MAQAKPGVGALMQFQEDYSRKKAQKSQKRRRIFLRILRLFAATLLLRTRFHSRRFVWIRGLRVVETSRSQHFARSQDRFLHREIVRGFPAEFLFASNHAGQIGE